ncbi:MAG: hypothetical protein AAFO94_11305 [Bacteroidota bacterium]
MKKSLILSLLALATLSFLGCEKLSNKGTLIITYLDESGNPKSATDVFLYVSKDNFDQAFYDEMTRTNGSGEATFDKLTEGNYYFDLTHRRGSITKTLSGNADIVAGETTRVTLQP